MHKKSSTISISNESKCKQIKISLRDWMDIIWNLDEAVLDALEKDDKIEEEINDVGRFYAVKLKTGKGVE